MHLQPVFRFEGHSSKLKAAGNYKNTYSARVVGGEVAPQLNTLKGPGSTGQGRLFHNIKRRYPARAIGGSVAQDLFERGLCLPQRNRC